MPRKLIDFELDFMIKDIFPRFTVKQFDDVSFNIKPKKQGLDYDTTGMTGKIFIGVNNDMFMQTKNITVSNNNVNILLDRNMLQKNGRAYAEVELTDSNGTITSSSFIFNIDAKIGEGAKIPEGYEGFVAKYERLISEFKAQVNSTIDNCNTNINSTINNCNKAVDNKLNDVDNFIDNKILDIEKRFNTLTSSQQQDAEVIDARDGEVSLKARLDRDIEKAKQVYVELEGSYISTESSTGAIQDLEILGNTVQDVDNLADIKSVGELQEDGTYKMSILSTNGLDKGNQSYQENKCDILLPCQLEKVGDVSDRLYYDDAEKAWCIDKNIGEVVLNGNESWAVRNDMPGNTTHSYFQIENLLNFKNNICVCDKFTFRKDVEFNIEYIRLYVFGSKKLVGINIDSSKLTSQDVEGFKTWLSENPTLVKYQLATPQKIVLPLSTQITLNSFFGTTHIYMESGEVEGIIKCKIPKSLGATVQSLNNKTDILSDRIEAIEGLKDSQNMKYETDKGYLLCKETKNGVIDDLKIEGKTLVNLVNYSSMTSHGTATGNFNKSGDFIKATITASGTKVANFKTHTDINSKLVTLIINNKSTASYVGVGKKTSYALIQMLSQGVNILTINTTDLTEGIYVGNTTNLSINDVIEFSIMILEGDHTQNPPSYFEGLMSVGEDVDKIEVLSSNNLLEEDENYKQDKKQILYYNENGELEPIQELHKWDSIEKHSDNKWYYHKRSGKVVLNGSENWSLAGTPNQVNSKVFSAICNGMTSLHFDKATVIADKFKTVNTTSEYNLDDSEYMCCSGSKIYTRILNTKLSTQDVTGFKQWLQANNVTVVYQLAEEEIYELAPLHLDSYANETLILCNSGAISPKMEFSITSHINELVKAYGERINLLEEKVYKYMVTQNRMQLASTYSADSVTFKVDYFSLCGDEENYNEDLYNLILNNILVGKDNYDYDKMFTIILDYASWNQISWEQFDILVGLMDMQHNPPVEELPTEDEIEEIPNEIE